MDDAVGPEEAALADSCLAALAVALDPRLPQAQAQLQVAEPARQVTLFAVIAVPGSNAIDPKLAGIELQLRKLLPGHGFKLLDVRSKRLHAGKRCGAIWGAAGPPRPTWSSRSTRTARSSSAAAAAERDRSVRHARRDASEPALLLRPDDRQRQAAADRRRGTVRPCGQEPDHPIPLRQVARAEGRDPTSLRLAERVLGRRSAANRDISPEDGPGAASKKSCRDRGRSSGVASSVS